ncbi:MAG: bifunctional diaminohydroxyphosphoribosylaminopyrimidine deaminase/5-amino-6-(5-phosphoribosylamino)uracil reductase RibD [Bacteroidetes bacterium]|nr:MAG: bifunctional diaminohydroxyphosphoribosylaminopyrimidine deaminase/5-amino-6-(5-phosphoribosylamino)uracil reductase RibD [Bacteroidota bacterium]
MTITNEQAMKRAIVLALNGIGYVSPNPMVGAVILKNDEIISEGWHHKFGTKHAEIDAIDNAAGIDLEGCTLVVNLEPCSHQGKTPPCTTAIIEKKISKVIIGLKDPNPSVNGAGMNILSDSNIEILSDILPNECRWLNRFFIKHITTGIPYVILKCAQSIDGCIATSKGESHWISGEESRKRTHRLRALVDAVLIGKRTAEIDNPSLTVRNVNGRNPFRIILDSELSISPSNKVFSENEKYKVIIVCHENYRHSKRAENLRASGINILAVEEDEDSKLSLKEILKSLYSEYRIGSVLVEGGAGIFSSFARANMIDELHIFTAPKIIGDGIHSFERFNITRLAYATNLKLISSELSGEDIHSVFINS